MIEANHHRLRSILVATLSSWACAAAGARQRSGAAERRTSAVVVVGGQTLSLFPTLVITPVGLVGGLEFLILVGPHSTL